MVSLTCPISRSHAILLLWKATQSSFLPVVMQGEAADVASKNAASGQFDQSRVFVSSLYEVEIFDKSMFSSKAPNADAVGLSHFSPWLMKHFFCRPRNSACFHKISYF